MVGLIIYSLVSTIAWYYRVNRQQGPEGRPTSLARACHSLASESKQKPPPLVHDTCDTAAVFGLTTLFPTPFRSPGLLPPVELAPLPNEIIINAFSKTASYVRTYAPLTPPRASDSVTLPRDQARRC